VECRDWILQLCRRPEIQHHLHPRRGGHKIEDKGCSEGEEKRVNERIIIVSQFVIEVVGDFIRKISGPSSSQTQKKPTTPQQPQEVEKNVTKARKPVGTFSVLGCQSEALASGFGATMIKDRIPSYIIEEVLGHRLNIEKFDTYWKAVLGVTPPKVEPSCAADVVEAIAKEADACFNRAEMMLQHAKDSLVSKPKEVKKDTMEGTKKRDKKDKKDEGTKKKMGVKGKSHKGKKDHKDKKGDKKDKKGDKKDKKGDEKDKKDK